jgi:hypothetical protein
MSMPSRYHVDAITLYHRIRTRVSIAILITEHLHEAREPASRSNFIYLSAKHCLSHSCGKNRNTQKAFVSSLNLEVRLLHRFVTRSGCRSS